MYEKISFKLIAGLIAVVSIALFQACIPPIPPGGNCPTVIPNVNGIYNNHARGLSIVPLDDSTFTSNEVRYAIADSDIPDAITAYIGTYTINGCGDMHFTFNRTIGGITGGNPINPAIECTGKFTAGAPDKVVMNKTPDHAGVLTFNKQ